MNLPNKLTIARIVMAILIIAILLIPLNSFGVELPTLFINESIVVDLRYFIAGALFILASLTDFLDGFIARKYHLVTDFGKMMDAIADKVLVNSVLIILSATGFIHPIIPVVIVVRDIFVNSVKMVAGNKGKVVAASILGKLKTACLMIGIILTLFYNLPFELWNFQVSNFLLMIAAILAMVSGVQYYYANREFIFPEKSQKIETEKQEA